MGRLLFVYFAYMAGGAGEVGRDVYPCTFHAVFCLLPKNVLK